MNASTAMTDVASRPPAVRISQGAGLTAVAAVLFPRVNAVMYDHEKIWQLDREAAVLIPILVGFTLLLFATIGRWSLRGTDNRPAVTSLATGVISIFAVLGFWISAPIIFGGLALTLGSEGLHRAASQQRRRLALAGIVAGVVGVLAGAAMWLAGV